MQINIPSVTTLTELQSTVQFIQLISTKEGLQQAIDTLVEKRKEIEEAEAAIYKSKQQLSEQEARIAQRITEAEENTKTAHESIALADQRLSQADKRMAAVKKAEDALIDDRSSFEAYKARAEAAIAESTGILNKREEYLSRATADAEAVKKEFNEKLNKLRATVA